MRSDESETVNSEQSTTNREQSAGNMSQNTIFWGELRSPNLAGKMAKTALFANHSCSWPIFDHDSPQTPIDNHGET
jgi:hypothetical protein